MFHNLDAASPWPHPADRFKDGTEGDLVTGETHVYKGGKENTLAGVESLQNKTPNQQPHY